VFSQKPRSCSEGCVVQIEAVPGGIIYILGGHSIGLSKQKGLNTYTCPIPSGFRVPKFVNKKEILCTVSITGIYYPSDKVGTVYPVQYIFENSTVNINALCNTCEDMACCSSV
jgi:hypothetical protein